MQVKGWEKIYQVDGSQRKAGVAIEISNRVDFRAKRSTGQRGALYNEKKKKRSVHQEDRDILNVYVQSYKIRLIELKGDIDKSTYAAGD